MNELNTTLSQNISNFLFMLTDEVIKGLNDYINPNFSASVEYV